MEWMPIETAPRDGVIEIPLTMGKTAIIDVADLPLVSGRSWQACRRHDGKCWYAVSDGMRMHRIITGAKPGEIVDHADGDGLNNRRQNLRIGTQSLNSVNRRSTPGPYLRGTRPKKGKWQAYIKVGGRQRSLGYYKTESEAHAAYLSVACEEYGPWMPLPAPPKAPPRSSR